METKNMNKKGQAGTIKNFIIGLLFSMIIFIPLLVVWVSGVNWHISGGILESEYAIDQNYTKIAYNINNTIIGKGIPWEGNITEKAEKATSLNLLDLTDIAEIIKLPFTLVKDVMYTVITDFWRLVGGDSVAAWIPDLILSCILLFIVFGVIAGILRKEV